MGEIKLRTLKKNLEKRSDTVGNVQRVGSVDEQSKVPTDRGHSQTINKFLPFVIFNLSYFQPLDKRGENNNKKDNNMIKKSLLVCGVFVLNLAFGADFDSGSETDEPSSPTRAQYVGAVNMVRALSRQDGHLSASRQKQLDDARLVMASYESIHGRSSPLLSPKTKRK